MLSKQSLSPIRADPEEGLQDCLIRLKELIEGYSKTTIHLSEHRKIKEKEINNLEDSIAQLIKEKEEISGFLRNALANKQELSSLSENGTNKPAVISMVSIVSYIYIYQRINFRKLQILEILGRDQHLFSIN